MSRFLDAEFENLINCKVQTTLLSTINWHYPTLPLLEEGD